MGQTMKKRMVELWSCGEAYLEETKLFHSSPGADVGKAGLWETRKAVSEVHRTLDVVMVHLLGRVVRLGYGRMSPVGIAKFMFLFPCSLSSSVSLSGSF